jgi:leucyl aminopeptidase (aminopeptidase T)
MQDANCMFPARMLVTLGILALCPASGSSQDTATVGESPMATASKRLEALAPLLVKSAQIKPGQLVTIHGGPQMIAAMEALAIEVQKGGATPVMLLESPKVTRSYFSDVPDAHLGKTPRAWQDFQAAGIDLQFQLPVFENFLQTIADVPSERQAKVFAAFSAGQAQLTERQNRNRTRRMNISGPPTAVDAEQAGVDLESYSRMYYEGLGADYAKIAQQGRKIQQAVQGARRVRITTPEGTDLSFAVGNRPVILDAGMPPPGTQGLLAARTAQLPGGAIRVAPVETSVTGKIRAPRDHCDKPVKDEAIDVRAGMPENVRAASDEACVQ